MKYVSINQFIGGVWANIINIEVEEKENIFDKDYLNMLDENLFDTSFDFVKIIGNDVLSNKMTIVYINKNHGPISITVNIKE